MPNDPHLEYLKNLLIARFGPDEGLVRYERAFEKMGINRFLLDVEEDERLPRGFGVFKSLVGLVLKKYNANTHKITPFRIPIDWPVTAGIDWHLNKPQAISFYAVNPHNMHFVHHEIWQNLDAEGVADAIIRCKIENNWRLELAFIDPLAKGDEKFVKNRLGNVQDSFTVIKNKLAPYRIRLEVGSKDKEASGIPNVERWLKGPSGVPILYFFNTLERHFTELARWVYDENGKPAKEFDDMMENLYRYTLFNVVYTAPLNPNKKPKSRKANVF